MKLYYKYTKRPKTVRELINDFYQVNEIDTYSCLTSKATYYDKEYKSVQCESAKRRSLTDLHILCKTYFPNVSLKKVFFELLLLKKIINSSKIMFLKCGYCYDMQKMKLVKNYTNKAFYDDRNINFVTSSKHTHPNSGIYLSYKIFGKRISNKELLKELSKYKEKYP